MSSLSFVCNSKINMHKRTKYVLPIFVKKRIVVKKHQMVLVKSFYFTKFAETKLSRNLRTDETYNALCIQPYLHAVVVLLILLCVMP